MQGNHRTNYPPGCLSCNMRIRILEGYVMRKKDGLKLLKAMADSVFMAGINASEIMQPYGVSALP